MLFIFTLTAVLRSRGMVGGKVHAFGAFAHRLLDFLIRRVTSFDDGVRTHRSFWNNGVARKGTTFFAGRAYTSVLAPLMACRCHAVIPEDSQRRSLIACFELIMYFFQVARAPTAMYGGRDVVTDLLCSIVTKLGSTIDSTFHNRGYKKGGDDDFKFCKLCCQPSL